MARQLTFLLMLLVTAAFTAVLPACGARTPVATTRESSTVVVGEDFLTAETAAAPGQPRISREQAIAAARRYVPAPREPDGQPAGPAADVNARYVTLTVRAGTTATPIVRARRVWLVTFRGVTYDPPDNCACAEYYRRPATTVAVDAGDGSLVTVYGQST